ncbi:MAG: acetyl-CoA hydrolase/transferase C-terminal domain-containing protein [Spirochaetales bacterium]|uniref:Acetyl-CoA hydrolase/transferase C-terminal domain-containing protein n=1 Tax=Candidatus Thalassospirochaeta sargassi TaxID=3119039 RepID=A0AAJ1MM98_9SPIO|nr:acetyl-CoA hydrolase/transferase C-terminal domain-containing protein [Spirochaetales bacterium]
MSEKMIKGSAEQAAGLIKNGMTVAMGGWAMAGYPKAVPEELVRRVQNGEELSINLITGANVPWLDDKLGAEGIVARRAPMIASRALAAQTNNGTMRYVEQQMNKMPKLLRRGSFGRIDVAVVEALGFDDDGNLIPTSSVGMAHYLLDAAEHIIVEINRAQPERLRRLHDIHIPAAPPETEPIPLTRVNQRIGESSIAVDRSKIRFIVETDIPERMGAQPRGTEVTGRIASHLFNFLELEVKKGGGFLPPVQLGFGSIADSIASAFAHSSFADLQFFCGGVTEPVLELFASGRAAAITAGGIGMSERVEEIIQSVPDLRDRLVLRNGDITNSSEVISRLGLIALNTGIEMDIYGNVNSSHISGSRVVNGIGGGAGFAQNAGLSVMMIPSVAKGGAISGIVPMVSHLDINEHDIDVVITENGLADLRGLDDGERADAIIANCAADSYKAQLSGYLKSARERVGGHHPQLIEEASAWHRRLKEEGSMLEKQS